MRQRTRVGRFSFREDSERVSHVLVISLRVKCVLKLTRRWILSSGKGLYVGGTLISILISLALYATGRRESAIFVGLWAPTILNLGQSLLEED